MKPKIKIGPAGLGSVKTAEKVLEEYASKGIKACEIAFTYGVYIKDKQDAVKIGKKAKELGISLSIHAPYWINLNSAEKEKIEKSKQRILNCCKTGTLLQATHIVFHPGYYGKFSKEQTYKIIKEQIIELEKTRKQKEYTPKLAPETTGKVNVFGSIEEISSLVKDTKCSFCIDFAHVLAREKKVDYKKIKKAFPQKNWHCHFSGIEYGEKGEKRHKLVEKKEWKNLFNNLPKNKNIKIICESPAPFEDAVRGLKILKSKD